MNDTGALTEPWSDAAPVLGEFTVTPDPIVTAGFIELAADCTDDWGVAEVRFLVDGALVAAAPTPPFAAEWLVKSADQIGEHTLAVECEDIAGNIVTADRAVSVSLPGPGTTAWSEVRLALKGSAEALDAAAAPDGSWWICGYADNLIGGAAAWNDVLVNKVGQFEIAGQAYVGKDDWDMALQVYSYLPGDDELTSSIGMTHGTKGQFDIASAIVRNLDGTVTLIGTVTDLNSGIRAAAIKLDAQHQVDTSGSWPFTLALQNPQVAGAMDGSIDGSGTLRLTGWHRKDANSPSRVMTLALDPDGVLLFGNHIEPTPQIGDNIGQGVAHFSDGTYLVTGSVTTSAVDHDIWAKRLTGADAQIWKPVVFAGLLGSIDEPRAVGINAFDQALIVGFETVIVQQDGQAVAVRQAWLKALHG